jgi:hypothetical protein
MADDDLDSYPFDAERNLHTVGEFVLTWTPQLGLFEVSRNDGGRVPAPLASRWTSIDGFQHAHEALFPPLPEPPSETSLGEAKLGEYPNSRTEHDQWQAEQRSEVTHVVGPYVLQLDPKWRLYTVTRSDGQPVAKSLTGRWTSVDDFRARAIELEPLGSRQRPLIEHTEQLQVEVADAVSKGANEYLEGRAKVKGDRR